VYDMYGTVGNVMQGVGTVPFRPSHKMHALRVSRVRAPVASAHLQNSRLVALMKILVKMRMKMRMKMMIRLRGA
jgi:hypothetical protein